MLEIKNLQTERKKKNCNGRTDFFFFLSLMYTAHAFSIYHAVLQCCVSASWPPPRSFCSSSPGSGDYNFRFSGYGTIPGTCSIFGECLEWTVELNIQYNLKNAIMEPVWIPWKDRRRLPTLFCFLATVSSLCQMTASSDCIWTQFHLDSNFT